MKKDYDIRQCVYCGMIADSKDHLKPKSFMSNAGPKKANWVSDKVLACKECNSLLGNVLLFDVNDRAKYVKEKLRKRYKVALNYQPPNEYSESDSAAVEAMLDAKEAILFRVNYDGYKTAEIFDGDTGRVKGCNEATGGLNAYLKGRYGKDNSYSRRRGLE